MYKMSEEQSEPIIIMISQLSYHIKNTGVLRGEKGFVFNQSHLIQKIVTKTKKFSCCIVDDKYSLKNIILYN